MLSGILTIFVQLFYFPAYFFFGLVSFLFRASGIDQHTIASCQTASILYIPVWLLIAVLVYYGLHKTKQFEKQLQFVSLHRHSFMILYSYVVLWMYSLPVGCENVWKITKEFFFIHRGMPMQFSGAILDQMMVKYPFITLFGSDIPSYRVVWYIPNMLTNFAIILGMTYLTYFILKHLPIHIYRHRRRRAKK